MTETEQDQLEAERANLRRIQAVHARHLYSARITAERLAGEAAEATEDGIRDLYDEDAEADAAIAAAMVRQFSDRAMHAYRRVAELEAMGQALAFGYTADDDGKRLNVGRLSVIDGEEALLVDWRAEAAVPFYRATPLDRLGVEQRRHLLYGDGVTTNANVLEGYSDEIFALDALDTNAGFRGEAALLASVTAPTEDQMRSVVATIQAEQDAVIRAPANKPLVVQGGPGTGKTVVALHRAAYLLYSQRANLSESGVLVVGPTAEFLNYIRGVLPSLGETGVVSVTVAKLFPGVLLGLHDEPAVAEVKGRTVMADVLAAAVSDRRRRPAGALRVYYGSRRVDIPRPDLEAIFDRAGRYQTYNEGARAFADGVIDALSAAVYSPSFGNMEDANESFASSVDVRRFLLRHWPPLSPEQALNDLLGSKALLASAAAVAGLDQVMALSLHRKRTSEIDLETIRWSGADIPLLDELEFLVGGGTLNQIDERDIERDEADEFELAEAAADGEDAEEDEAEAEVGGDLLATGPVDEIEEAGLGDGHFGGRIYYEATSGMSLDGAGGLPLDDAGGVPVDGEVGS